jgi:hypothetical protein
MARPVRCRDNLCDNDCERMHAQPSLAYDHAMTRACSCQAQSPHTNEIEFPLRIQRVLELPLKAPCQQRRAIDETAAPLGHQRITSPRPVLCKLPASSPQHAGRMPAVRAPMILMDCNSWRARSLLDPEDAAAHFVTNNFRSASDCEAAGSACGRLHGSGGGRRRGDTRPSRSFLTLSSSLSNAISVLARSSSA